MGRRGARALAIGVAVAGFVLLAFGVSARPAEVKQSAQAFFNFDRPGINAHNSPAVAADPARPRTVALVDRIDTPAFSCSVSLSRDLGDNWAPVEVPLPADAPNCFWPDVGFDNDGRMLVLYTATGGRFNLPVGVWLQRYDAAEPEGPPVKVAGSEAFHAHMAVEGPDVLVAYVQATPDNATKGVGFTAGPNPIVAVRSSDGGRTFAPAVTVSEPGRRVVVPNVVLGADGKAVVAALDLGNDVADYEATHDAQGGAPDDNPWSIVAYRSSDGGATFSKATLVAGELVPPQRLIVNLAPVPGLARDAGTGRLYASWDAGRADRRDVFVATSGDDGASWSKPVAVVARRGAQTLPAVGVAPDGRVDVVFYDRSEDPEDNKTEVAMASSWNEGATFTVATVSDRQFDSRLGYGSLQGIPVLSSQLAVLSTPGKALAFWSDTRRTTQDDNATELALAVVSTRQSAGRHPFSAVTGLVLLAVGVGLAVRER